MTQHPARGDAAAVHAVDRRRARWLVRILDVARGLCGWLQFAWLLGLAGLAVLICVGTMAGVIGRLQHGPGATTAWPQAWTPLVAVFIGTTMTGAGIAAAAIVGRLVCSGLLAQAARLPSGREALGEFAARPAAPGMSLGRSRLVAIDPPGGSPRIPGWLRCTWRGLWLAVGLGGAIAGLMVFALGGAGTSGGLQPLAAILVGLILVVIALRPMPGAWAVEDGALTGWTRGWGWRRRTVQVHLPGAHIEPRFGGFGPLSAHRRLVVEGRTSASPMQTPAAGDSATTGDHRGHVDLGTICPGCTGAVTVQRLLSLPAFAPLRPDRHRHD